MSQAHFDIATSSKPGITLLTKPMDDGGIELYISAVNHYFMESLAVQEQENLVGRPLLSMMEADQESFDEWVDFVLRSREMPYVQTFTQEDEETITCQMLQYLYIFEGWRMVTVEYFKNRDQVTVHFDEIEEFDERAVLWQLMLLIRYRRLAVHVNSNANWVIDCLNQRMFLSRRTMVSLGMGIRSVVVTMREFLRTIHPDDLDRVISTLDNIKEVNTGIHHRNIRADGEILHLLSYAIPFYDQEGRLTRIIGLSENVSEAMRSKDELAVADKRFTKILEAAETLFLSVDGKGRYRYVSPTITKLLGVEPELLLGRAAGSVLLRPEEQERVDRQVGEIIKNQTSGELECRVRGASGGLRWFRFKIFTMPNEVGGIAETIAFGQDITREKYTRNQIQYLTTHDSLTKTYNRTFFWTRLEELYKEEQRDFCLVLLDVNGLGLINNVYGQAKGDRVLADVADAVKKSFRRARSIARIGGDEFAVIVYNTDMEKIACSCAAMDTFCEETKKRLLPISVSWGTACRNESGTGVQDLFRIAESRMYSNKTLQTSSMHSHVVSSLKEALRARNAETSDHLERMELMVTALGKRLGLSTSEFDKLSLLASMHDIGKVAIPDHILCKPGSLTDDEWEIMRSHTDIGHRIAMSSKELSGIAGEILHHHERWDGKGYPNGEKGDEIPLLSQIIAVADAYDVMTHARIYKEPIPHKDAMAELERCSGSQFSPRIVTLFHDIFSHLSDREMNSFVRLGATGL